MGRKEIKKPIWGARLRKNYSRKCWIIQCKGCHLKIQSKYWSKHPIYCSNIFGYMRMPQIPHLIQSIVSDLQLNPQILPQKTEIKNNSVINSKKSIRFRQQQTQIIHNFLLNSIKDRGSRTSLCKQNNRLVLIGPPGTGKSLIIDTVLQNLKIDKQLNDVSVLSLNAMKVIKPYKYIAKKLKIRGKGNPKFLLSQFFKGLLQSQFNTKTIVLIIDEIDCLSDRQQFLYLLTEWSQIETSHLINILISNSMKLRQNLPTKILSRLGDDFLIIKPYLCDQLIAIIIDNTQNRLSLDRIRYICKKFAQSSSDLRKLIDIIQKAQIEKTENQFASIQLQNNIIKNTFQHLPLFYKKIISILVDYQDNNIEKIMNILNLKTGKNYKFNQIYSGVDDLFEMGLIHKEHRVLFKSHQNPFNLYVSLVNQLKQVHIDD